jgi:hypothetical protein
MSKIRAHAEDDFATFGIIVRLAAILNDGDVNPASGITEDGRIEYSAEATPGSLFDPVLCITHDEAHAIYDALGVALNRSHPHADQGRADLLAERVRVDRLIEAVAQVATGRGGA